MKLDDFIVPFFGAVVGAGLAGIIITDSEIVAESPHLTYAVAIPAMAILGYGLDRLCMHCYKLAEKDKEN